MNTLNRGGVIPCGNSAPWKARPNRSIKSARVYVQSMTLGKRSGSVRNTASPIDHSSEHVKPQKTYLLQLFHLSTPGGFSWPAQ